MPTDHVQGMSGVLFDLDDTLLDYSSARDAAVVAWAEGFPVSVTGAELVELWRRLEDQHFPRYVTGELSFPEQRRARVRGLPGMAHLDDDEADGFFSGFLDLSERHWRPLLGAVETVRRIADRVPVGVLTNGAEQLQARKLASLGLGGLPLFASTASGLAKPRSGAFVRACLALGSDPATTLMVGDNIDVDVRGALAAGLRAVWVNSADAPVPPGIAAIRSVADLG